MPKKKTIKPKTLPKPVKSKDLPATREALEKVRAELKSDFTSVKLEIKSVKTELKGEITTVRSEVKALRDEMNSKFEEIKSTNQRMLALLEEQNSRNRAALDGYAAVHDAHLRLEDRVDKIEANQFDLAKILKNKDV